MSPPRRNFLAMTGIRHRHPATHPTTVRAGSRRRTTSAGDHRGPPPPTPSEPSSASAQTSSGPTDSSASPSPPRAPFGTRQIPGHAHTEARRVSARSRPRGRDRLNHRRKSRPTSGDATGNSAAHVVVDTPVSLGFGSTSPQGLTRLNHRNASTVPDTLGPRRLRAAEGCGRRPRWRGRRRAGGVMAVCQR